MLRSGAVAKIEGSVRADRRVFSKASLELERSSRMKTSLFLIDQSGISFFSLSQTSSSSIHLAIAAEARVWSGSSGCNEPVVVKMLNNNLHQATNITLYFLGKRTRKPS